MAILQSRIYFYQGIPKTTYGKYDSSYAQDKF